MTTSALNTFAKFLLTAGTVRTAAAYDDAHNFTVVKVWATAPQSCTLTIYYCSTPTPTAAQEAAGAELHQVNGNTLNIINSKKKNRYVKVSIRNTSGNDQADVSVLTKFDVVGGHQTLTYAADDTFAKASVELGDITVNQAINHGTASIAVYGVNANGTLYPVRTDNSGTLTVTGNIANGGVLPAILNRPIVVGGSSGGPAPATVNARTLATDDKGALKVSPFTKIGDQLNVAGAVQPDPVFLVGGSFFDNATWLSQAKALKVNNLGMQETKAVIGTQSVGSNNGVQTTLLPTSIAVGMNADGTPRLVGRTYDGQQATLPIAAVANVTVNDNAGFNIYPADGETFTVEQAGTAASFAISDGSGVMIRSAAALTVTPTTAKYSINDDAGVNVSQATGGQITIAPVDQNTKFLLNSDAGIHITPRTGETFLIEPFDNNTKFKLNDAAGIKVYPTTGKTFTITTNAASAAMKIQGTEGILNTILVDPSAFTYNIQPLTGVGARNLTIKGNTGDDFLLIKPTTDAEFRISALSIANGGARFTLDDTAGIPISPTDGVTFLATVENCNTFYTDTGNTFVTVNAAAKTVYSLHIINTTANLYYVKLYTGSTPSQTAAPFMVQPVLPFSFRDIPFPRGISLGAAATQLSIIVSNVPGTTASNAIAVGSVHTNITWSAI